MGDRVANRILVVDDNREAADALGRLLSTLGHDVLVVYSGEEGIEHSGTFRPAVAFVDIAMPGLDSYRTAERLRQQRGEDRIVLVALTGFAAPSDKLTAYKRGFDVHVPKPISLNMVNGLLAMVEHVKAPSGN
jgi:CheY-like chemotaxis protein